MDFFLWVILVIFIFEYINGFHDAANAIATVVSTHVLTRRTAVLMAAVFNLAGALSGQAVAVTVGAGLVEAAQITLLTILCAMLGGIIWNLATWWWGLPSSSSHALIGGLCGAALASAGDNWDVIKWSVTKTDPKTGVLIHEGLFPNVVVPMITSPLLGLLGGFIIMTLLFLLVRGWPITRVNTVFGNLQILSAAYVAWGHGFADAQKTMGVVALASYIATKAGKLESLPPFLDFLYTPQFDIPLWARIASALVMGLGTWAGGWRIIRTLGHKLVSMKPVHGLAAESTAASILLVFGHLGMPISTTYAITTSIVGVGLAKGRWALDLGVMNRILTAWIFTIPATALLAYWLLQFLRASGFQ